MTSLVPSKEPNRSDNNGWNTPIDETDLGNAKRFIARNGESIRYVHQWKTWLIWTGTHWLVDQTDQIMELMKETAESIAEETCAYPWKRDILEDHALRSQSKARLEAAIALARSNPEVAILPKDLDRDPWLLNVQNGTIDLHTGELREHNRGDLITKVIPVEYDSTAVCPKFVSFLHDIMAGDQEMIDFLQRAVGYSTSGVTYEQVLFFLYGFGKNGKSTFVEIIRGVLGEYAQKAPTKLLEKLNPGSIPNEIARLKGARFAMTSELAQQITLDEAKIKDLTGGDTLPARFLHKEWFEFAPTHTLWIYGNYKPKVKGVDDGIWRRVVLVPFTVKVPESKLNKTLKEELLRDEKQGILTWIVAGAAAWYKSGLVVPDKVRRASEEYRADSDSVQGFIGERCVLEPDRKAKARELYDAYTGWCTTNHKEALSEMEFKNALLGRGLHQKRRSDGKRWLGIALKQGARPKRLGDRAPVNHIHKLKSVG